MKNVNMREKKWKKWNERNEELDSKGERIRQLHSTSARWQYCVQPPATPRRCEFQAGRFLHSPKLNSQNKVKGGDRSSTTFLSKNIYTTHFPICLCNINSPWWNSEVNNSFGGFAFFDRVEASETGVGRVFEKHKPQQSTKLRFIVFSQTPEKSKRNPINKCNEQVHKGSQKLH